MLCRVLLIIMLNVVMRSVVILSVVAPVILVDVHGHKNEEDFKPSFKTFRKIILRHFSTFIPDGSNSGKASNKRINTNDN
jgi:hypothetical protein